MLSFDFFLQILKISNQAPFFFDNWRQRFLSDRARNLIRFFFRQATSPSSKIVTTPPEAAPSDFLARVAATSPLEPSSPRFESRDSNFRRRAETSAPHPPRVSSFTHWTRRCSSTPSSWSWRSRRRPPGLQPFMFAS